MTATRSTCVTADGGGADHDEAVLHRFGTASSGARSVVPRWLDKAEAAMARASHDQDQAFDAFLYAWIAFNAWSSVATSGGTDKAQLDALCRSEAVRRVHEAELRRARSYDREVSAFQSLWPIRNVARNGAAPECFDLHRHAEEQVPGDLPHVLRAIYAVRNNLFHGQKVPDSARDHEVVYAAASVLVPLLRALLTASGRR
jgi:hypothetical protein